MITIKITAMMMMMMMMMMMSYNGDDDGDGELVIIGLKITFVLTFRANRHLQSLDPQRFVL